MEMATCPPGLDREFHSVPRAPSARLEWFAGTGDLPLGVVAYRVRDPALRQGTLVYLNGTQSHAGWFEPAATALAALGFDVLCLDRRGSGINRRRPGLLSGHVDRYEDLVTDVKCLVDALVTGGPLFLAGVSWGGKLALACAPVLPLDGLVLITPALVVPRTPTIGTCLQIFFYSLLDASRPLPFEAPASAFTRVPALIEMIETDPLRLDVLSARFMMENSRLQRDVVAGLGRLRVPVQLFLAGEDPIIDSEAVEVLLHRALGERLRVVRYPDLGHVLPLEDPGRFSRDAGAWMSRQGRPGERSSTSGSLAGG